MVNPDCIQETARFGQSFSFNPKTEHIPDFILIHPVIVGKGCYPMFASTGNQVNLSLIKSETHGEGLQWQVYEVNK